MISPELIHFKATDNVLLPGLLFEPKRKTHKAAIYLHGNGSSSVFYNPDRYGGIALELNKLGIAFFPFNNRGAFMVHRLTARKKTKRKKVMGGTAFELIKDCVKDIDGAMKLLAQKGYKEFYLVGHSTGANKICVYNYLKPKNRFKKYVLFGGADDMGLMYKQLGRKNFFAMLKTAERKIKQSQGIDPVPMNARFGNIYSYRSLFDTINPDGYYNTFPFLETLTNLNLSKKKLFREFRTIKKPTLVLYGAEDEFCIGGAEENARILKTISPIPEMITTKVVPGADHGFHGKEKQLGKIIAGWLHKT